MACYLPGVEILAIQDSRTVTYIHNITILVLIKINNKLNIYCVQFAHYAGFFKIEPPSNNLCRFLESGLFLNPLCPRRLFQFPSDCRASRTR